MFVPDWAVILGIVGILATGLSLFAGIVFLVNDALRGHETLFHSEIEENLRPHGHVDEVSTQRPPQWGRAGW